MKIDIDPRLVVKTYREAGSYKETARILGVSMTWVGDTIRRMGLGIGKGSHQRKCDPDNVLHLWEKYQDRHIVATKLDIHPGYVGQILWKKFGIRLPRKESPLKYNLPMDDLAQRYRDGETCGEIARNLGIPSERIRRRLTKHGVKIRSAAESVPRGKKNIFYKDGRGSTYRENKYQSKKAAVAYLGRELPAGWVVHHQDENPQNLDLENLYLFPSIATHSAYHTQLLSRQKKGLEVDAIQLVLENGGLPLLQHPLRVPCERDIDQPDPLDKTLLRETGQKLFV